jgi:hypothetical protein
MSKSNTKHGKPAPEISSKSTSTSSKPSSTSIPEAPTVHIRTNHIIIRLLVLVYLLSIFGLGYWYWMRPVRADQFKDAHEKWRAVAKIFHVPVPKDERWGW